MPNQSPLHPARLDFERAGRCVDRMKAAPSLEEYEDAWRGYLEATYSIPNRIMNAGVQTLTAEELQRFKSWFGTVEAQRNADPFLGYCLHARNAESHTIQITTKRQPGEMSFQSTGSTYIQEIKGYSNGRLEIVGSGSPIAVKFTPSKVIMIMATDRGVDYEAPDDQPPHIHAEAALPFIEEWIKKAEAKFFPT